MPDKIHSDHTLFAILKLLTKDARLSNKQIAAAVGIAPSTCHERLKQLRESGLYRGAHADIDIRKLGIGMEALIRVELAKHERNAVDEFVARLTQIPEVRQVFLVAGDFDLLAHVVIRDMEHLKNLAYDHFTCQQVVARIETAVVFQSWTQFGRLPIPSDRQSGLENMDKRKRVSARKNAT
jgi:DNA-binding Lrp family transcriptional regulator